MVLEFEGSKDLLGRGNCRAEGIAALRELQGRRTCRAEGLAGPRNLQGRGTCRAEGLIGPRDLVITTTPGFNKMINY